MGWIAASPCLSNAVCYSRLTHFEARAARPDEQEDLLLATG
jgi:hypothetical protein